MTEDLSPLRDDTDVILPAAAYLRYEQRADGWSVGRQAACLAHLADNGRAADAVRSVGMSAQSGYALRRQARGYAFNLGWEAALIIARRIVADDLMTAAIRGEQSVWLREDGKTTYTRQNSKLALTLLDRVNPATALPEVLAVAMRFDCFLMMIDDGLSAQQLWEYFFDDVLTHDQPEARARVRAALQLCEESAIFDEDEDENDDTPTEYKSMEGVLSGQLKLSSHEDMKARRSTKSGEARWTLRRGGKARFLKNKVGFGQARPLHVFVSSCESKSPKVDGANQSAYLSPQARPGREAQSNKNAPPNLS